MDETIKVLIVEDSKSTANALMQVLDQFDVVGVAENGSQALRMNARLRPDVITMDIMLPDTDGLALAKQILEHRKVPIIIVSALVSPDRQQLAFDALSAGAYDVFPKSAFHFARSSEREPKLVRLVKAAASRRRRHTIVRPTTTVATHRARRSLLCIGASTGGPAAHSKVLGDLPSDFSLPIVIAQHMSAGFVDGFVRWLDTQTALSVEIAVDGQMPEAGRVYLPPSEQHIVVDPGRTLRLVPLEDDEVCPSVDRLFDSASRAFGPETICLLMTGMGDDGARGMALARQRNAQTAAQDEKSSVIFGMPKQAMRLNAARCVLSLDAIATWLLREAGSTRTTSM
jgi:two-component system chemotaxis response regulator CheB